ncbi:FAD-linked oxidase [Bdellovibrio bacteriovorus]|uniref:Delta(24)-sterol reductase n=1 Tax=Bdellovibrio bacteriovorus TaxID=959 RepID=A0A150WLD7_BDEBC|nr:FAD-binding oxidoreductase [Bdellovibrio bacteriovorus]KYG64754.1 FAD-linked oxidase [Bdellovibrio bacteriovorus]
MSEFPSWGFYPPAKDQSLIELKTRFHPLPTSSQSILPRGLGRSYGDSCLNNGGSLIDTHLLNHFIEWDHQNGVIRCEAGVSFDEILKLVVPKGWFLPVTPGTKFVTVGGAIANDVHGKNHHKSGNFGNHILCFELLRSSGERLICSRRENSDLFFATIGGLGLTGLITWAEFKLAPINSSWIVQEQIQFHSLAEFFQLSIESEKDYEFTVSWVDCVTPGKDVRGIFIRGNQASPRQEANFKVHADPGIKQIPFFFPEWSLNSVSVRAFNELYYRKNLSSTKTNVVHYEPFYYPLDAIHNWNRIYGRRGFLQYQCVVPYKNDSGKALEEIFSIFKKTQMGSFLAVLKTFGAIKSEGLLSFPREGVTLALDFAKHGIELLETLELCDKIVRSVGGAVYPAKDARMTAESFHSFFPRAEEFKKHIDPQFSSSFWRRIL